MAPSRTRTVKNKHAAKKISNSKEASRKPIQDGIVKKKRKVGGAPATASSKGRPGLVDSLLKRKKRTYSEKELGIPQLNMITPVGVVKPPGKKKGKEFVDDRESMATIMSIVQAEKNSDIESKVMKARQMEEIREARRVEAETKEDQRQARLNETKDSLRKKRRRNKSGKQGNVDDDGDESMKDIMSTSAKAAKAKKKVSFA
ncbi:hypothetical protein MKZ38_007923 [Zalerion maritima]|uniref:60S ribosomal subunit assembly/export protein LOC1 n=1 Tax=Zalerion maritima TaxID=339359 RepID=A0AAD5RI38_9PEZI|nr:hypothetical protein MKZ38_007923 [Zalerion maritima]